MNRPVPLVRTWWYNGFDYDQRRATILIQNAAVRDGRLKRPTVCSVCGFSDPSDLSGRGYIFLHLEDYRRPLEVLPCCKACHAALHGRFESSGRWHRIVERHRTDGRWFAYLTMNSASQMAPFDETYPNGLPCV